MAGLDLTFEDILGRKAKQQRQREAAVLAQSLLEKGADPDAVNQIANKYSATGDIKIPDYQEKALPYDPDVPEGRSTLEPFSLDKKKKGLFNFNAQTGEAQQINTPDDMSDFEVRSYNEPKPRTGHSWKIDRATGDREDLGENGGVVDTYVYWNSKTGQGGRTGGKGGESPDEKLIDDTIKKYQDSQKTGKPMTPEFIDSAKSAFDARGIPFQQQALPATFGDKAQNLLSKVTGGAINPADARTGLPVPNFANSSMSKRNAAIAWLQARKQKVTDANVAAVIQKGLAGK